MHNSGTLTSTRPSGLLSTSKIQASWSFWSRGGVEPLGQLQLRKCLADLAARLQLAAWETRPDAAQVFRVVQRAESA